MTWQWDGPFPYLEDTLPWEGEEASRPHEGNEGLERGQKEGPNVEQGGV